VCLFTICYSLDITDESLDKRINDIEKELEQIYNQKAKGAQRKMGRIG
jgi:50S ribosomal subunit-associated GTPase HflX